MTPPSETIVEIDPGSFERELRSGANVLVVDIRDRESFAGWHIPACGVPIVNVPEAELAADPAAALAAIAAGAAVRVICDAGNASKRGAAVLEQLGGDVRSVHAGMIGWSRVLQYDDVAAAGRDLGRPVPPRGARLPVVPRGRRRRGARRRPGARRPSVSGRGGRAAACASATCWTRTCTPTTCRAPASWHGCRVRRCTSRTARSRVASRTRPTWRRVGDDDAIAARRARGARRRAAGPHDRHGRRPDRRRGADRRRLAVPRLRRPPRSGGRRRGARRRRAPAAPHAARAGGDAAAAACCCCRATTPAAVSTARSCVRWARCWRRCRRCRSDEDAFVRAGARRHAAATAQLPGHHRRQPRQTTWRRTQPPVSRSARTTAPRSARSSPRVCRFRARHESDTSWRRVVFVPGTDPTRGRLVRQRPIARLCWRRGTGAGSQRAADPRRHASPSCSGPSARRSRARGRGGRARPAWRAGSCPPRPGAPAATRAGRTSRPGARCGSSARRWPPAGRGRGARAAGRRAAPTGPAGRRPACRTPGTARRRAARAPA